MKIPTLRTAALSFVSRPRAHRMFALLPLALASIATGQAGDEGAPTRSTPLEVFVETDAGWRPAATAASGFHGQPGLPIPLASRSERVQTVHPTAEGYRLMLRTADFTRLGSLEFLAIPHAEDEQVLLVDGELTIVGPPHLVSSDTALARHDGLIGPAAEAALTAPPEGLRTLAIAGGPATRTARALASSALRAYTFDHVFAATTRPALVEPDVGRAVLVEARLVDIIAETPPTAEGPWDVLPGPLDLELASDERIAGARGDVSDVLIGRGRALVVGLDLPMVRRDTAGRSWTLVVHTVAEPAELAPFVHAPWMPAETPVDDEPLFEDVTGYATGDFMHLEGPPDQRDIRPTMGPGVAAGDVDGDGWVDLFVVQGEGRPELRNLTARLFLNQTEEAAGGRSLRFRAVTNTGLEIPAAGMGALLFDADGDGDLDLYQANQGRDFLFFNRWNQRTQAGEPFLALPGERYAARATDGWSAGIAAGDVDLDGDLDLYVTTYLVYDEAAMPDDGELGRYQREDPVAMLPFAFPGGRNLLLLNESAGTNGELRFRDATDEFGLADEAGRGMQPVFWDFDGDGDVDLYVANDVSMNKLWRNEARGAEGGRRFKDVSFSTGMDDPRGGMGVDIGDVDGDADEDLFLTNWQLEPNALYLSRRNERFAAEKHRSTFKDAVVEAGLASTGVGTTSWGGVLFDMDNDADLDLFVPNGYTSPDYRTTGICVGQPNQLFENAGDGAFVDVSAEAGRAVTRPLASRAATAVDFDLDGDLDLVVTANNGPLQVLQNSSRERLGMRAGHWVVVRLRGAGANSQAIGARVRVVTEGADGTERIQTRSLLAGHAYLAGNAPELYFGLGSASTVVRYEVQWPGTGADAPWSTYPGGLADRVLTLEEAP